jgi:hypothetical protein
MQDEKLQGTKPSQKRSKTEPQSFLTFAREGDDFGSKENKELTFGQNRSIIA